jgi:CMP-N,N'-diacetyllegionaminic acid synthase
MRIVALVPARAGSKRIPHKNVKLLGGKPLIQWTIEAARESGVFDRINVCSDDPAIVDVAYNSLVGYIKRQPVTDEQPDIEWVRHALDVDASVNVRHRTIADAFAILRPTSPFRTADTIRRAVQQFKETPCSSLRAVERAKQHPGKMWQQTHAEQIVPLLEHWTWPDNVTQRYDRPPMHSRPTQQLPPVWVQNSSLEIAHRWCVDVFDSISGPKVAPFFTEGMEGFSLDYPDDWERAERYVAALQTPPAA